MPQLLLVKETLWYCRLLKCHRNKNKTHWVQCSSSFLFFMATKLFCRQNHYAFLHYSIANLLGCGQKKRGKKKRHGDGENVKMISEGFYLILWKEASLIGPKQHREHIINHSIITTHQSILMPALVINSVDDNPLIVSHCWELGFDDNLIQIVVEPHCICRVWASWSVRLMESWIWDIEFGMEIYNRPLGWAEE